jgi:hypothetical protein
MAAGQTALTCTYGSLDNPRIVAKLVGCPHGHCIGSIHFYASGSSSPAAIAAVKGPLLLQLAKICDVPLRQKTALLEGSSKIQAPLGDSFQNLQHAGIADTAGLLQ